MRSGFWRHRCSSVKLFSVKRETREVETRRFGNKLLIDADGRPSISRGGRTMAERPGRARRVRKRSRWGADEIEYSSSGSSGDEQAGPDEAERACRLTESSSPSPADAGR